MSQMKRSFFFLRLPTKSQLLLDDDDDDDDAGVAGLNQQSEWEVLEIEKRELGHYNGLEEEWMDVERFLKLMIVDGCFFLDVMIWHTGFFFKPYMTAKLWMDMFLLENQLPLAALAVLIEMGVDKVQDTEEFIKYYPNSFGTRFESIREMGFQHLHIFLKNTTMEGGYFYNLGFIVRPATELLQAGVRFMKSKPNSFKDVSLIDGVLRLPCFQFDDIIEACLLNFLAFEQILNADRAISSFASHEQSHQHG